MLERMVRSNRLFKDLADEEDCDATLAGYACCALAILRARGELSKAAT
jgi:hypothetical protein